MTMGWQCPGCGRCFSPGVAECTYCGPVREGLTTDGTGVVPWVVPTTFDPSPCLHVNKEQTSAGERCLACGQYMPVCTAVGRATGGLSPSP